MKAQTNEMTTEQLEDIKRIKVFTIVEYLEQQIEFIALNYKDIYSAYQKSKENKTKIEQYEESAQ